jgi:hypothetical protein
MLLMFKSYISWVVVWGIGFLAAVLLGLTPEVTLVDRIGTEQYVGPTWGVWITLILSTIFGLTAFFSTQSEITNHAYALSQLRVADEEIKNQEEHLAKVKENFDGLRASLQETLKDLPEQLMNQDNPVSALVNALMEEVNKAERALVKAKNDKLYYEAKVHARKIGPWAWIVEKYGDGS